MSSELVPTHQHGWMSFPITGQTAHSADAAGCIGYIKNPEDCDIIVTQCIVYTLVNSTGAANLTISHATTVAGAHDATALFAAASVADSHGTATTGIATGDVADSFPVVLEGSYIAAFASADTSGLVARAYIHYLRTSAHFTA
jgi:hypothetical protein